MDELDLYDDLDEFQEQQDKKSKELQEVEEKYQKSLKTIEELESSNKSLQKKIQRIELSFQSLLDTARLELQRKDKEIERLRKEKDDICFRRRIPQHSAKELATPHSVKEATVATRQRECIKNPFKSSQKETIGDIKQNSTIIEKETSIVQGKVLKEHSHDYFTESNKRCRYPDEDYDDNYHKKLKNNEDHDEKHQEKSKFHKSDRDPRNKDEYQARESHLKDSMKKRDLSSNRLPTDRIQEEKDLNNKFTKSRSPERLSSRQERPRNDSLDKKSQHYNKRLDIYNRSDRKKSSKSSESPERNYKHSEGGRSRERSDRHHSKDGDKHKSRDRKQSDKNRNKSSKSPEPKELIHSKYRDSSRQRHHDEDYHKSKSEKSHNICVDMKEGNQIQQEVNKKADENDVKRADEQNKIKSDHKAIIENLNTDMSEKDEYKQDILQHRDEFIETVNNKDLMIQSSSNNLPLPQQKSEIADSKLSKTPKDTIYDELFGTSPSTSTNSAIAISSSTSKHDSSTGFRKIDQNDPENKANENFLSCSSKKTSIGRKLCTPQKLVLYDTLFGPSPTSSSSSGTSASPNFTNKSLLSNIKHILANNTTSTNVEVISSATTSPGDYTDIGSSGKETPLIIDESSINDPNEIDKCFTKNYADKESEKNIGCVDLTKDNEGVDINEIEFIQIPGLDLPTQYCGKGHTIKEDCFNEKLKLLFKDNATKGIISEKESEEETEKSWPKENNTVKISDMEVAETAATENQLVVVFEYGSDELTYQTLAPTEIPEGPKVTVPNKQQYSKHQHSNQESKEFQETAGNNINVSENISTESDIPEVCIPGLDLLHIPTQGSFNTNETECHATNETTDQKTENTNQEYQTLQDKSFQDESDKVIESELTLLSCKKLLIGIPRDLGLITNETNTVPAKNTENQKVYASSEDPESEKLHQETQETISDNITEADNFVNATKSGESLPELSLPGLNLASIHKEESSEAGNTEFSTTNEIVAKNYKTEVVFMLSETPETSKYSNDDNLQQEPLIKETFAENLIDSENNSKSYKLDTIEVPKNIFVGKASIETSEISVKNSKNQEVLIISEKEEICKDSKLHNPILKPHTLKETVVDNLSESKNSMSDESVNLIEMTEVSTSAPELTPTVVHKTNEIEPKNSKNQEVPTPTKNVETFQDSKPENPQQKPQTSNETVAENTSESEISYNSEKPDELVSSKLPYPLLEHQTLKENVADNFIEPNNSFNSAKSDESVNLIEMPEDSISARDFTSTEVHTTNEVEAKNSKIQEVFTPTKNQETIKDANPKKLLREPQTFKETIVDNILGSDISFNSEMSAESVNMSEIPEVSITNLDLITIQKPESSKTVEPEDHTIDFAATKYNKSENTQEPLALTEIIADNFVASKKFDELASTIEIPEVSTSDLDLIQIQNQESLTNVKSKTHIIVNLAAITTETQTVLISTEKQKTLKDSQPGNQQQKPPTFNETMNKIPEVSISSSDLIPTNEVRSKKCKSQEISISTENTESIKRCKSETSLKTSQILKEIVANFFVDSENILNSAKSDVSINMIEIPDNFMSDLDFKTILEPESLKTVEPEIYTVEAAAKESENQEISISSEKQEILKDSKTINPQLESFTCNESYRGSKKSSESLIEISEVDIPYLDLIPTSITPAKTLENQKVLMATKKQETLKDFNSKIPLQEPKTSKETIAESFIESEHSYDVAKSDDTIEVLEVFMPNLDLVPTQKPESSKNEEPEIHTNKIAPKETEIREVLILSENAQDSKSKNTQELQTSIETIAGNLIESEIYLNSAKSDESATTIEVLEVSLPDLDLIPIQKSEFSKTVEPISHTVDISATTKQETLKDSKPPNEIPTKNSENQHISMSSEKEETRKYDESSTTIEIQEASRDDLVLTPESNMRSIVTVSDTNTENQNVLSSKKKQGTSKDFQTDTSQQELPIINETIPDKVSENTLKFIEKQGTLNDSKPENPHHDPEEIKETISEKGLDLIPFYTQESLKTEFHKTHRVPIENMKTQEVPISIKHQETLKDFKDNTKQGTPATENSESASMIEISEDSVSELNSESIKAQELLKSSEAETHNYFIVTGNSGLTSTLEIPEVSALETIRNHKSLRNSQTESHKEKITETQEVILTTFNDAKAVNSMQESELIVKTDKETATNIIITKSDSYSEKSNESVQIIIPQEPVSQLTSTSSEKSLRISENQIVLISTETQETSKESNTEATNQESQNPENTKENPETLEGSKSKNLHPESQMLPESDSDSIIGSKRNSCTKNPEMYIGEETSNKTDTTKANNKAEEEIDQRDPKFQINDTEISLENLTTPQKDDINQQILECQTNEPTSSLENLSTPKEHKTQMANDEYNMDISIKSLNTESDDQGDHKQEHTLSNTHAITILKNVSKDDQNESQIPAKNLTLTKMTADLFREESDKKGKITNENVAAITYEENLNKSLDLEQQMFEIQETEKEPFEETLTISNNESFNKSLTIEQKMFEMHDATGEFDAEISSEISFKIDFEVTAKEVADVENTGDLKHSCKDVLSEKESIKEIGNVNICEISESNEKSAPGLNLSQESSIKDCEKELQISVDQTVCESSKTFEDIQNLNLTEKESNKSNKTDKIVISDSTTSNDFETLNESFNIEQEMFKMHAAEGDSNFNKSSASNSSSKSGSAKEKSIEKTDMDLSVSPSLKSDLIQEVLTIKAPIKNIKIISEDSERGDKIIDEISITTKNLIDKESSSKIVLEFQAKLNENVPDSDLMQENVQFVNKIHQNQATFNLDLVSVPLNESIKDLSSIKDISDSIRTDDTVEKNSTYIEISSMSSINTDSVPFKTNKTAEDLQIESEIVGSEKIEKSSQSNSITSDTPITTNYEVSSMSQTNSNIELERQESLNTVPDKMNKTSENSITLNETISSENINKPDEINYSISDVPNEIQSMSVKNVNNDSEIQESCKNPKSVLVVMPDKTNQTSEDSQNENVDAQIINKSVEPKAIKSDIPNATNNEISLLSQTNSIIEPEIQKSYKHQKTALTSVPFKTQKTADDPQIEHKNIDSQIVDKSVEPKSINSDIPNASNDEFPSMPRTTSNMTPTRQNSLNKIEMTAWDSLADKTNKSSEDSVNENVDNEKVNKSVEPNSIVYNKEMLSISQQDSNIETERLEALEINQMKCLNSVSEKTKELSKDLKILNATNNSNNINESFALSSIVSIIPTTTNDEIPIAQETLKRYSKSSKQNAVAQNLENNSPIGLDKGFKDSEQNQAASPNAKVETVTLDKQEDKSQELQTSPNKVKLQQNKTLLAKKPAGIPQKPNPADPCNKLSILPSISTNSPTPSNFSGLFAKKSLENVREDEFTKAKKKFPHFTSTKPREYILPAASVLCNIDNLENATKANKKLHWELLDNKNEMTEIEDDTDVDNSDEERRSKKVNPEKCTSNFKALEEPQLKLTPYKCTEALNSDSETLSEDETRYGSLTCLNFGSNKQKILEQRRKTIDTIPISYAVSYYKQLEELEQLEQLEKKNQREAKKLRKKEARKQLNFVSTKIKKAKKRKHKKSKKLKSKLKASNAIRVRNVESLMDVSIVKETVIKKTKFSIVLPKKQRGRPKKVENLEQSFGSHKTSSQKNKFEESSKEVKEKRKRGRPRKIREEVTSKESNLNESNNLEISAIIHKAQEQDARKGEKEEQQFENREPHQTDKSDLDDHEIYQEFLTNYIQADEESKVNKQKHENNKDKQRERENAPLEKEKQLAENLESNKDKPRNQDKPPLQNKEQQLQNLETNKDKQRVDENQSQQEKREKHSLEIESKKEQQNLETYKEKQRKEETQPLPREELHTTNKEKQREQANQPLENNEQMKNIKELEKHEKKQKYKEHQPLEKEEQQQEKHKTILEKPKDLEKQTLQKKHLHTNKEKQRVEDKLQLEMEKQQTKRNVQQQRENDVQNFDNKREKEKQQLENQKLLTNKNELQANDNIKNVENQGEKDSKTLEPCPKTYQEIHKGLEKQHLNKEQIQRNEKQRREEKQHQQVMTKELQSKIKEQQQREKEKKYLEHQMLLTKSVREFVKHNDPKKLQSDDENQLEQQQKQLQIDNNIYNSENNTISQTHNQSLDDSRIYQEFIKNCSQSKIENTNEVHDESSSEIECSQETVIRYKKLDSKGATPANSENLERNEANVDQNNTPKVPTEDSELEKPSSSSAVYHKEHSFDGNNSSIGENSEPECNKYLRDDENPSTSKALQLSEKYEQLNVDISKEKQPLAINPEIKVVKTQESTPSLKSDKELLTKTKESQCLKPENTKELSTLNLANKSKKLKSNLKIKKINAQKLNSPMMVANNKKKIISLEEIGIKLRPFKGHLSSFRIPKINKDSEDKSWKLETYVEVSEEDKLKEKELRNTNSKDGDIDKQDSLRNENKEKCTESTREKIVCATKLSLEEKRVQHQKEKHDHENLSKDKNQQISDQFSKDHNQVFVTENNDKKTTFEMHKKSINIPKSSKEDATKPIENITHNKNTNPQELIKITNEMQAFSAIKSRKKSLSHKRKLFSPDSYDEESSDCKFPDAAKVCDQKNNDIDKAEKGLNVNEKLKDIVLESSNKNSDSNTNVDNNRERIIQDSQQQVIQKTISSRRKSINLQKRDLELTNEIRTNFSDNILNGNENKIQENLVKNVNLNMEKDKNLEKSSTDNKISDYRKKSSVKLRRKSLNLQRQILESSSEDETVQEFVAKSQTGVVKNQGNIETISELPNVRARRKSVNFPRRIVDSSRDGESLTDHKYDQTKDISSLGQNVCSADTNLDAFQTVACEKEVKPIQSLRMRNKSLIEDQKPLNDIKKKEELRQINESSNTLAQTILDRNDSPSVVRSSKEKSDANLSEKPITSIRMRRKSMYQERMALNTREDEIETCDNDIKKKEELRQVNETSNTLAQTILDRNDSPSVVRSSKEKSDANLSEKPITSIRMRRKSMYQERMALNTREDEIETCDKPTAISSLDEHQQKETNKLPIKSLKLRRKSMYQERVSAAGMQEEWTNVYNQHQECQATANKIPLEVINHDSEKANGTPPGSIKIHRKSKHQDNVTLNETIKEKIIKRFEEGSQNITDINQREVDILSKDLTSSAHTIPVTSLETRRKSLYQEDQVKETNTNRESHSNSSQETHQIAVTSLRMRRKSVYQEREQEQKSEDKNQLEVCDYNLEREDSNSHATQSLRIRRKSTYQESFTLSDLKSEVEDIIVNQTQQDVISQNLSLENSSKIRRKSYQEVQTQMERVKEDITNRESHASLGKNQLEGEDRKSIPVKSLRMRRKSVYQERQREESKQQEPCAVIKPPTSEDTNHMSVIQSNESDVTNLPSLKIRRMSLHQHHSIESDITNPPPLKIRRKSLYQERLSSTDQQEDKETRSNLLENTDFNERDEKNPSRLGVRRKSIYQEGIILTDHKQEDNETSSNKDIILPNITGKTQLDVKEDRKDTKSIANTSLNQDRGQLEELTKEIVEKNRYESESKDTDLKQTCDYNKEYDSDTSIILAHNKAVLNRRKSLNQRRLSDSSDEDVQEPINPIKTSMQMQQKTPLTAKKPRKRRVVKVLSTSRDEEPVDNKNPISKTCPPLISPTLNHPIFHTDVMQQQIHNVPLPPPTPDKQYDDKFKEIDSKLNEIFQSPRYGLDEKTTANAQSSDVSALSFIPSALNNTLTNITIEETIVSNQEIDESSENTNLFNDVTTPSNDSSLYNNSNDVKQISLGSSEYRFEKVSDNVVNLFISRKRKRKRNN